VGRSDERIVRNGHDVISTFGIGTDVDEPTWKAVFRQLIARGELEPTQHGGLRLTERSVEVLEGRSSVTLPMRSSTSARVPRARRAPTTDVAAPAETLGTADRALFHRLREVRLAIAQTQQVPAYVVFTDGVLADMARVRPTSPGELLGISGVGSVKLERYGEAFLEAIRTSG